MKSSSLSKFFSLHFWSFFYETFNVFYLSKSSIRIFIFHVCLQILFFIIIKFLLNLKDLQLHFLWINFYCNIQLKLIILIIHGCYSFFYYESKKAIIRHLTIFIPITIDQISSNWLMFVYTRKSVKIVNSYWWHFFFKFKNSALFKNRT